MEKEDLLKVEIDEVHFEEINVEGINQMEEVITPAIGSVLCCLN